MTLCANCGSALEKGHQYCPQCGQKVVDDLTFKELFNNTITNYFSVDARFFKSFLPLMLKPGVLARRFVDGKRQQYLHPAQFYLFISVIFFFLFSVTVGNRSQEEFEKNLAKMVDSSENVSSKAEGVIPKLDSSEQRQVREQLKELQGLPVFKDRAEFQALDTVDLFSPKVHVGLRDSIEKEVEEDRQWQRKMDSLIAADAPLFEKEKMFGVDEESGSLMRYISGQLVKMYERKGGGALKTFYDSIPISIFLLLPIFALLLKLFYMRRGNFGHHMVFAFYFFTFFFTVLTILLIMDMIWDVPWSINVLVILSTFFYMVLALRTFYRQGFFTSFIKAGFIGFLYTTLVLPLSFAGLILAAILLY